LVKSKVTVSPWPVCEGRSGCGLRMHAISGLGIVYKSYRTRRRRAVRARRAGALGRGPRASLEE
jgi:hypothetical protein